MLNVFRCLLCLTIYNFTLHEIGKIPSCPLQIYVQSWLTVPRHVTVTGAVTSAMWSFALAMHFGMRLQVIFSRRMHWYETSSKICKAHCSIGMRLKLWGYWGQHRIYACDWNLKLNLGRNFLCFDKSWLWIIFPSKESHTTKNVKHPTTLCTVITRAS